MLFDIGLYHNAKQKWCECLGLDLNFANWGLGLGLGLANWGLGLGLGLVNRGLGLGLGLVKKGLGHIPANTIQLKLLQ